MADSRKVKSTQVMEAFKPTAHPPPSSGKRVDEDRRGLAAFDRGAPPAPTPSHKGSLRWSGGGADSLPPPKADKASPPRREDDDLLRERTTAHVRDDEDDDMVPVSATSWGDVMAPTPVPRGRQRRPEPEPESEVEEEVEAPARTRRSPVLKWVLGGLLTLGVGAGAALGVAALKGGDEGAAKAPTPPAPAPKAAVVPVEEPEVEDEPEEAKADATTEKAEPDAASATAEVAPKTPPAPAITRAAWADEALAMNPWVEVPAAPSGRRMGLRDEELGGPLLAMRTGFRPSAKVTAPDKPYRLQRHEVSWAEIALATTLPELQAAKRPAWLPKAAAKAASLPATGVAWAQARAFCQSLGGDLPSEAEWEWAARGASDHHFPWGREAIDNRDAHIVASGRVPVVDVASSPQDKTPEPVVLHDLLGNAQEWTRDDFRAADPGAGTEAREKTHKAVRGWPLLAPGESAPAEGTTYRAAGCADPSCLESEAAMLARVGFRCALPR